ncbi:PIN domain-containing protein [Geitlerinema sp. P-1104]|uniref:type II toxin-antitoxin system VapC family toxin n=1 Tax=Geitlerinema sp. P-1104 TaxID=2546230 RepID=UPI001476B3F6|nr:type II toxin-antitoxin system VapC family toxin [Geitlerinema sp. P-1104]NMG59375.1 PIN domain-containing protein [Geitlerinema sp. P-1104]
MKSQSIFVDTSAWVALYDSRDDNHTRATSYRDECTQERKCMVITNYILDETYTLLLDNVGYHKTIQFRKAIENLMTGKVVELLYVTESIDKLSWEVFERFNIDKQWSFTDCTSYVIMNQHGIRDVFTFDNHFSQMGFNKKPIII